MNLFSETFREKIHIEPSDCPHFFIVQRDLIKIIKQIFPLFAFICRIKQWQKFDIQLLCCRICNTVQYLCNRSKISIIFVSYHYFSFGTIKDDAISSSAYSSTSVLVTRFICCFFRRRYTNSRNIV